MALPLYSVETDGDRLYVHEDSLKLFAVRHPCMYEKILVGLASAWVKRIVGHQLEDAVALGAVHRGWADAVCSELDQWWSLATTALFSNLSAVTPWRTCSPLQSTFVATCYESGYYTYASTNAAARRMFDDHVPLRELYTKYASGRDPLTADLTMVRGDKLRLSTDEHAPRHCSTIQPPSAILRMVLDQARHKLQEAFIRGEGLGSADGVVRSNVFTSIDRTLDRHVGRRLAV